MSLALALVTEATLTSLLNYLLRSNENYLNEFLQVNILTLLKNHKQLAPG